MTGSEYSNLLDSYGRSATDFKNFLIANTGVVRSVNKMNYLRHEETVPRFYEHQLYEFLGIKYEPDTADSKVFICFYKERNLEDKNQPYIERVQLFTTEHALFKFTRQRTTIKPKWIPFRFNRQYSLDDFCEKITALGATFETFSTAEMLENTEESKTEDTDV